MPRYDFKCKNKNCSQNGVVFEEVMDYDEYIVAKCPKCGNVTQRIFESIPFKFDFKYGFDDGQGEYFDSAAQRDESAARAGLRRIK